LLLRNCGLSLFATSLPVAAVCIAYGRIWMHRSLFLPSGRTLVALASSPILFLEPGDIIVWLASILDDLFWTMTSLSSWHTFWLMHHLYLWSDDIITGP